MKIGPITRLLLEGAVIPETKEESAQYQKLADITVAERVLVRGRHGYSITAYGRIKLRSIIEKAERLEEMP